MEEKSMVKKILGDWNTKTIVTVAIGAALYGILMVYGGFPVFTNTYLSLSLIVPVIVGSLCGALPTAVALFLGNVIADLIGGWGLWFDWSIGNGVMGFFIGLMPIYGANIQDGIFTVKHAIFYVISCVVALGVGIIGVIPPLSLALYGSEIVTTYWQVLFASVSNIIILVVLGLPILFIMANRFKARSNLREAEDEVENKSEEE